MNHDQAVLRAAKIYDYYYSHAIKEFDQPTSMYLAQIPADYVYNSLISQQNCYINNTCCLEYCNEILDSEFKILDPRIKRLMYEREFKVQSGVSDSEIDTQLKKRRTRKFKELYYNKFNELKDNRENQFNNLFKNMKISCGVPNLSNVFKTLQLN